MMQLYKTIHCIDISSSRQVREGSYIEHTYCIIINPKASLCRNIIIHKGVIIDQENRGD